MNRAVLPLLLWAALGCGLGAQDRPAPAIAAPDLGPAVCEADLDAPVAKVWAVFTTDEGFKRLGVAKARIEFRVGGRMLSHYDPAGVLGDDGTIENTIMAYEPQRMVAFRVSRPPKGFPFPNAWQEVWSVVTLTDLGGGRCHLRLAQMGYTAGEESQRMRGFFLKGNAWVLEHLRKGFAQP